MILCKYMSETQKTPNKSRRALVAGGVVGALGGSVLTGVAVDAAHRIFDTPDVQPPVASAEANPQTLEQQELLSLIDQLREANMSGATEITSFPIEGPSTSVYETALGIVRDFVGDEAFNANRGNIQGALLVSSDTVNTDQPEAPYITHPGQQIGIYESDVNSDGYPEYFTSLKTSVDNVTATGNQPVPGQNGVLTIPEGMQDKEIGAVEPAAKDSLKNDTH
jgi:hypothetical protein